MAKLFNACFQKISQTVSGRELTKAEKDRLQELFSNSFLKNLQDGTPDAQLVQKALEDFKRQRQADYNYRIANKAKDALALRQKWTEIETAAKQLGSRTEAARKLVSSKMSDNVGFISAERKANGMYATLSPLMHKVNNALGGPGWFENRDNVRAFVNAIYGKTQGISKEVLDAARIWSDEIAEPLRKRANMAGARIGKVASAYLPQAWDGGMLAKAFPVADDYVNFMFDKMDRARMVDELGTPLDDTQLRELLRNTYSTIKTDGAIKDMSETPKVSGGVKSRGSQSRELHFKDGDSYMAAYELFGRDVIQVALDRHIRGQANNIAAMETFGPSAVTNAERLIEKARALDVQDGRNPQKAGMSAALGRATVYEFMNAHIDPVSNGFGAETMRNMRNLQATKLGMALFSSVNDHAQAAMVNNLFGASGMSNFVGYLKGLNPASDTFQLELQNAGFATEVFSHSMYRNAKHMLEVGKTKTIAETTLTYSGLSSHTRAVRDSQGAVLANTIGFQTGKYKTLAELSNTERRLLTGMGVKDADWQIWGMAKKTGLDGGQGTYLTAKAIMDIPDADIAAAFPGKKPEIVKRDAAELFVGTIESIKDAAIFKATAEQRAQIGLGTKAGTTGGELIRTALQFKSFPFMMISNTAGIVNAMGGLKSAGGLSYAAAVLLSTTVAGAMTVQLKALARGEEPRPMDDPQFYIASVLAGGSMGIFGDLLFGKDGDLMKMALGPTIGSLSNLSDIMLRPTRTAYDGKDLDMADMAGDFAKEIRSYVPLSTLWYSRALFDRAVLHQIQEATNPGYLDRMQRKREQKYRNGTWWKAGEILPEFMQ